MKFVVGQEISDENGWRIVVALDDGGAITMDRYGAEHWEKETP